MGLTVIIFTVSCRKGKVDPPPPTVTTKLKLRDINVRYLPSPYYHFEYNDTGSITRADFSNGTRMYDVKYAGRDIMTLENADPNNRVSLEYVYINGDLVGVKINDRNGVTIRHCILSFSASHQLQQVDWDVRENDVGFALEQTITFSYYADGNLMDMVTHDYPMGSIPEATYTDRFENYDDHVNVDGFSLLHKSPHELILLPGIKLQLNNPRRNIHTGDGINYETEYTYTYDTKGRPVIKTGDLKFTNGTNSGEHFESQSTFSYYD